MRARRLRLAAHLGRRGQHGLPPAVGGRRRRAPRRGGQRRTASTRSPDSAWFTNRIGVAPHEHRGARARRLQPGAHPRSRTASPDGSWLIDHGKTDGSSPGFRVNIPGKGKYLFKGEPPEQPERPSAASVIGAAVYDAVGFNTSCEQVVYFRPSLLKLAPGLTHKGNFGGDGALRPEGGRQDPRATRRTAAASCACRPRRGCPATSSAPSRYTGTRARRPERRHPARRPARAARRAAPRGVARPLRRARAELDGHAG